MDGGRGVVAFRRLGLDRDIDLAGLTGAAQRLVVRQIANLVAAQAVDLGPAPVRVQGLHDQDLTHTAIGDTANHGAVPIGHIVQHPTMPGQGLLGLAGQDVDPGHVQRPASGAIAHQNMVGIVPQQIENLARKRLLGAGSLELDGRRAVAGHRQHRLAIAERANIAVVPIAGTPDLHPGDADEQPVIGLPADPVDIDPAETLAGLPARQDHEGLFLQVTDLDVATIATARDPDQITAGRREAGTSQRRVGDEILDGRRIGARRSRRHQACHGEARGQGGRHDHTDKLH